MKRREFLKGSALAGATTLVAAPAIAQGAPETGRETQFPYKRNAGPIRGKATDALTLGRDITTFRRSHRKQAIGLGPRRQVNRHGQAVARRGGPILGQTIAPLSLVASPRASPACGPACRSIRQRRGPPGLPRPAPRRTAPAGLAPTRRR